MLTVATALAALKGAGIPVAKGAAGAAGGALSKSLTSRVFNRQAKLAEEVVAMAVIRSIEEARPAGTVGDESWWSRTGHRLIKPFVSKNVAPFVLDAVIADPTNEVAVEQILNETLLRSGSSIQELADGLGFSEERFMAVIVDNVRDELYTAAAEHNSPLLARAHFASSRQLVELLSNDGDDTGRSLEQAPVGRIVGSLTDDDAVDLLGVRPAPPATGQSDASALPPYLLRDIDNTLRTSLLAARRNNSGGIVVLSGDSGTGKSRTAWETIKFALPDWRIWFDLVPGYSAATFDESVAAGRVSEQTILWLNDAQNYFEPGGEGGKLAAAIIEWIKKPGPRLVVATIWPESLRRLNDDKSVIHAAAHKLLHGNVIAIPDSFTERDLKRTANQQLIQSDSRLQTAVTRDRHGRVAQNLSGVFAIQHEYANSNSVERAILWAATDAHRLSSRWRSIPEKFLHDAAPGYLTDSQWKEAQPWSTVFQSSVERLTARVCGSGGLLDRHIPRPNAAHDVGYQLTDVLEQQLRAIRYTEYPPTEFWDAAASIVDSLNSYVAFELGASAICRGRFRRGYQQFILPAARRGNASALEWLAHRRLDELNTTASAADLVSAAVEAGATSKAWARLALRVVSTDTELSVRSAILAARAGNTEAGEGIAMYFADRQNWAAAINVAHQMNPYDSGEAISLVAILMAASGQIESAEALAGAITDDTKSSAVRGLIRETIPIGPPSRPIDLLFASGPGGDELDRIFINHRTGELSRRPKPDFDIPDLDLIAAEGWSKAEERALADAERGDAQPLFTLAVRRSTSNTGEARRLARLAVRHAGRHGIRHLAFFLQHAPAEAKCTQLWKLILDVGAPPQIDFWQPPLDPSGEPTVMDHLLYEALDGAAGGFNNDHVYRFGVADDGSIEAAWSWSLELPS